MKTKIAITLFVLITGITQTFSFNPETVIESRWYGKCKQYSSLFAGGVAWLNYDMYDLNYNSYDNTFSGKFKTTIEMDGYTYTNICNITGTYNPSDAGIRIHPGSASREDQLPGELYWTYDDIKATLSSDGNRSGYYLMKGYLLDGSNYMGSSIELSNSPSYI
jgi:hypothetical protein